MSAAFIAVVRVGGVGYVLVEILFGRLCAVPLWARANLQALIAIVFSLCHLAFF